MNEDDLDLNEEFDPIGESAGKQRVVFIFDDSAEAEMYLNSLHLKYEKKGEAWQVKMNIQST
jgi:hypothetical protein